MTKLGAQPGVHGGEDLEKEVIKIDPKVFTVLQPTVIPMPAPIHPQKSSSPAFNILRAAFHCLFFVTCLLLVTLLGFYLLSATPELFKIEKAPQMEALTKQVETSSEKAAADIVSIPLARVVVVEDISNNSAEKKTVVDGSVEDKTTQNRPLHPDEMEQFRMMQAMEERAYMEQMMAIRMWRMRRLQAAYYQQQQMKMAYFQQQQQQQQQIQEEMARQQWAERARYEEDQRRHWEAQQAFAQQQRAQAFWQQHQMEMAQQAQQAQVQAQQWQRPSVWQQPPPNQQFFFPQQHQQQEFIPQPSVHDKIYEELQKKSQNIPVNAPTRQIWTAITPTPAPEVETTPVVEMTATSVPDAADVSDTILRDIFSAFDEQKNSEAATKELSTTQEPELEGKGAVVIEDSFPRIEERTTTPETVATRSEEESDEEIETSSSMSTDDHEKELDPFAAVLKFFENNPPRGIASEEVTTTTETPAKPITI